MAGGGVVTEQDLDGLARRAPEVAALIRMEGGLGGPAIHFDELVSRTTTRVGFALAEAARPGGAGGALVGDRVSITAASHTTLTQSPEDRTYPLEWVLKFAPELFAPKNTLLVSVSG